MRSLAERLELTGIACVAPAAPGGSWYPRRFIAPRKLNEPHLSGALATVQATLDELEARGVPPGKIVLGGFSQGACLACDAIATRRSRGASWRCAAG
jgi:glyoxalase family protein